MNTSQEPDCTIRGRRPETAPIVVDRAAAIRQRELDIDGDAEDEFSIDVEE